jgi:hypothetical protein
MAGTVADIRGWAMGITAYPKRRRPPDDGEALVPRTTKLYGRRDDKLTLDQYEAVALERTGIKYRDLAAEDLRRATQLMNR